MTDLPTAPEQPASPDHPATPSAWRLIPVVAAVVAAGVAWGWYTVVVILAVAVCIFLHELGHYLAARRAGMKVTEFFIGFGPRIWSFRRGETEFGLKPILLGAYVKVPGMLADEEVDPADEPRTYRRARFRDRLLLAVAGSAMHFAIALTLLFLSFSVVGFADGEAWKAGVIVPGSAAEAAGIRSGDVVLSIDSEPVKDFRDVGRLAGPRAGQKVAVVVERDGRKVTTNATIGQRQIVYGTVGEDLSLFYGADGPVVQVPPGSIMEGAGLVEGDVLVSLNGTPVSDASQVAGVVKEAGSGVLRIEVERGGVRSVHRLDLGSELAVEASKGFLGIGAAPVIVRSGPLEAVGQSFSTFGELTVGSTGSVVRILNPANIANLVTRAVTIRPTDDVTDTATPAAEARTVRLEREVDRPLSIVGAIALGSRSTDEPVRQLVNFLVMINVVIGVFNLVPLLPLDGGHVAVAVYERIREWRRGDGRRYLVDPQRLYPLAFGVIVVLGVLGLSTIYMDVVAPIRI